MNILVYLYMDYSKIYRDLVSKARNRTLSTYTEKHHIIPKCQGGGNEKLNIVSLTAREHYLAHKLLLKIHPNNISIYHAFWMMSNRFNIKSREYEELKIVIASRMRKNVGTPEAIAKMSKSKKGQKIWLGKTHTQATKDKMSVSAKNRTINLDNENKRREGISKNNKKPKSKTHSQNISNSKKGSKNPMFGKKWKIIDGKRFYYTP